MAAPYCPNIPRPVPANTPERPRSITQKHSVNGTRYTGNTCHCPGLSAFSATTQKRKSTTNSPCTANTRP